MNAPFKVGDIVLCGCGSCRIPFTIAKITDWKDGRYLIEGENDEVYVIPEDNQLRLVTPLEKLL